MRIALWIACAAGLACLPAFAVDPAQSPSTPFAIDLPLAPAQQPASSSASTDFLLSGPPRIGIECRAADGITYASLQSGASRCTTAIAPTFIALSDTFAYYVVRAQFVKSRGVVIKSATTGYADIKGTAPFSNQAASAQFDIVSPNRAPTGNIGMELLGAAAKNVDVGITALAARAGIPVPLRPPDWDAIRAAAVNIQADLRDRAAERLVLTDLSVSVWLCNARVCSPPGVASIPVDQP